MYDPVCSVIYIHTYTAYYHLSLVSDLVANDDGARITHSQRVPETGPNGEVGAVIQDHMTWTRPLREKVVESVGSCHERIT